MGLKKISLLGSTGSIGVQTLDVLRATGCAKVAALSANKNIDLLERQIIEFRPLLAVTGDEKGALDLLHRLQSKNIKTDVLHSGEGLLAAAAMNEADVLVNALVGQVGLRPTLAAIRHKKEVALANKETLVAAGAIVTRAARENKVNIYPIDSEHSAIFQCLQGNQGNAADKLYLTASGGPFRGKTADELNNVTLEQALKHPNWTMGAKITIDSATMMNKGLEVIEAHFLFDVPLEKIEVLVHPQSVIHSMVQFSDGAVMAQLGMPDMRVPIQYALTYPKRLPNHFPKINFLEHNHLTFEAPDFDLFPCLKMAYDAIEAGGALSAVMNAANEIAVARFLGGEIRFLAIARIIEKTMGAYTVKSDVGLDDIFAADAWARAFAADVRQ